MEQIEQYTQQLFTYITLETIFFVTVIGLTMSLIISVSALKHARMQRGLRGKKTNNQTQEPQDNTLAGRVQALEQKTRDLDGQLPRTAIVRYNPFRDSGVGGNQSFSLATVDSKGNGSLITHLFSREMSRVSAKQITAWQSDLELSPEEKQALDSLRTKKQ